MMLRRWAALAAGVLVVAGCTNVLGGEAVSVFDDPFHVAGLPATDSRSGLRPDAKDPSRDVENSSGNYDDELARQAVSDIEEFWEDAYSEAFDGTFEPVKSLISWDADGEGVRFCRTNTAGLVNALYCFRDDTIGWDRALLLPELKSDFGEMAIPTILAHEYGHGIQRQAGLADDETPTLVAEQQADCFAGVFTRWVAEDKSPRFTINTGDGLNNVLAAMISLRDPLFTEDDPEAGVDEHGSAFERVSAFQFGFTDGPKACAAIDEEEIAQRRGNLPVALPDRQSGEWDVTEDSVRAIIEALEITYRPKSPPSLNFSEQACPDARPSPPASYCPATNTISVDVAGLKELADQSKSRSTGLSFGDNTAYSILASRFMLAVQHDRGGLVLDNAEAALRTACLTGAATAKLTKGVQIKDGTTVALTAGDIDEAVSGILTTGLAASDVNGESVPAGFSRIDAFRLGVLRGDGRCYTRYP